MVRMNGCQEGRNDYLQGSLAPLGHEGSSRYDVHAEGGGGRKRSLICGQKVQTLRTEVGEGVKNPRMLLTLYMDGP